jgi:hypothetical protein
MDPDPPVVAPGTDQERAAWLASRRAEPGLAVVDEHGRFQGLIPPHRLAGILLDEHEEDLARLGGFLTSTAAARAASQETVDYRWAPAITGRCAGHIFGRRGPPVGHPPFVLGRPVRFAHVRLIRVDGYSRASI